ncbi:MAG: winged helix-turn-helix domain-containing protein [Halobacteriales archaeon]|nr:winged helix-turn-helix domain-containing protein [Halobacteriales archaeon]
MQRAHLAVLALLCASAPVAAQPVLPLEFQTPAQLSPQGDATGLEWMLLLFQDGSPTTFELEATGSPVATNHTLLAYGIDQPPATVFFDQADLPPKSTDLPEGYRQTLAFSRPGWASLYIAASSIAITHAHDEATAFPVFNGSRIQGGLPEQIPPTAFRTQALRTWHDDAGFLLHGLTEAPFTFHLAAQGVHHVEYTNAHAACPPGQATCLDGASPTNRTVPTPGGRAGAALASILEVRSQDGHVQGNGTAAFILMGGQAVTLHEDGEARLPLASRTTPCHAPCLDPNGQTVRLLGNLTFTNLRAQAGNRLAADLSGHFVAANLDETPVPSSLLGNVEAAVAVAVGLGLASLLLKPFGRFLLGLFSRQLTPQKALDNPGRQATYDAVRAHPGATYRAIMRATGLSDSITRHHLAKLELVGMVVKLAHGRTLRYFENHGRYADNWKTVAARRDPDTARVMDWLLDHPGSSQQDTVRGLAGAVKRGAVLGRLNHLEDWGLAEARQDGGAKSPKRYRLLPEQASTLALAGAPTERSGVPSASGLSPSHLPVQ